MFSVSYTVMVFWVQKSQHWWHFSTSGKGLASMKTRTCGQIVSEICRYAFYMASTLRSSIPPLQRMRVSRKFVELGQFDILLHSGVPYNQRISIDIDKL